MNAHSINCLDNHSKYRRHVKHSNLTSFWKNQIKQLHKLCLGIVVENFLFNKLKISISRTKESLIAIYY